MAAGALVGAEYPALEQRGDEVRVRHNDVGRVAATVSSTSTAPLSSSRPGSTIARLSLYSHAHAVW
jgi:hypothetical protein